MPASCPEIAAARRALVCHPYSNRRRENGGAIAAIVLPAVRVRRTQATVIAKRSPSGRPARNLSDSNFGSRRSFFFQWLQLPDFQVVKANFVMVTAGDAEFEAGLLHFEIRARSA